MVEYLLFNIPSALELNSACTAFRVKRANLHLWNNVRRIIYIYIYIYVKNPPFDSLVWGSLRLTPIRPQLVYLFLIDRRMDFLQSCYHHLFLFSHISDIKQTSDRHHEHRDEGIANKHASIMYSIQKNPSTMADKISADHPATKFVNFLKNICRLCINT